MIGQRAFESCKFKGELNLPKKLLILENDVFVSCNFSGELKFPPNLRDIGVRAFAYNIRLSGVLDLPQTVKSIGGSAFQSCRIEEIILPEN